MKKGKYGNVSIDDGLLYRVDLAVKKGVGRSRASLVRSAVLEYLERHPPPALELAPEKPRARTFEEIEAIRRVLAREAEP